MKLLMREMMITGEKVIESKSLKKSENLGLGQHNREKLKIYVEIN
jgi:hypothetical protein